VAWWTVFYFYAGALLWFYLPPPESDEGFWGHLLFRHGIQWGGLLCLLFVLWDRDRLPLMESASSRWRAGVALALGILSITLLLKSTATVAAFYNAPLVHWGLWWSPTGGLTPIDMAADIGAAAVGPAVFAVIARRSPYAASIVVFVLAAVWAFVQITYGSVGALVVGGAGALIALGVWAAGPRGAPPRA
jgi:hypothetical protein